MGLKWSSWRRSGVGVRGIVVCDMVIGAFDGDESCSRVGEGGFKKRGPLNGRVSEPVGRVCSSLG